jgi:hypothetical protein
LTGAHELSNRVEHDAELSVVLSLERVEFSEKLRVLLQQLPKAHMISTFTIAACSVGAR